MPIPLNIVYLGHQKHMCRIKPGEVFNSGHRLIHPQASPDEKDGQIDSTTNPRNSPQDYRYGKSLTAVIALGKTS